MADEAKQPQSSKSQQPSPAQLAKENEALKAQIAELQSQREADQKAMEALRADTPQGPASIPHRKLQPLRVPKDCPNPGRYLAEHPEVPKPTKKYQVRMIGGRDARKIDPQEVIAFDEGDAVSQVVAKHQLQAHLYRPQVTEVSA